MATNLYKLTDGRIVINQATDNRNRLVYIMEDGSQELAENCSIKEFNTLPKTQTIKTEIKLN
jgi:hypothetical protein